MLQEVNGFGTNGAPLSRSTQLAADGTTSCGCWIYCGCYADGVNQTARRRPGAEQDWVAAEWAWAWPANRRLLYNRASADPAGEPWSERKRYLWWDEAAGKWAGPDVPDFPLDTRPGYRPPEGAGGLAAISGTDPFIMQSDGLGWLFAPTGLVDGPLPTHYEPHESPITNPLYGQQSNPARKEIRRRGNRPHPTAGQPGADVFPYVITTYRLTEHHTAGGMSRFLAYLAELQPAPICEVGPELAAERGLVNGEWATVVTARSAIEARVLVTDRLPALLAGRPAHPPGRPPLPLGDEGPGDGRLGQRPARAGPRSQRGDPGVEGGDVRRPARASSPGTGAAPAGGRLPPAGGAGGGRRCLKGLGLTSRGWASSPTRPSASGARRARWRARSGTVSPGRRVHFLGQSYDNTGELGADTWRHVAFIEQKGPADRTDGEFRWLMSSDVCKHCTSAACLEVCPTGSLVRTEFGTVVVQEDICNGCGYCVPACPFGVIDQRQGDGRAWKCTMCYDRLRGGLEPACATACPTKSIQFGPLDELRARAAVRVETLQAAGVTEARLYGADPSDGVGGMGAFFLLLDDPEVYRLPPDPVVTTRDLPGMWRSAAAAAATLAVAAAFLGRRPR